MDNTLMLIIGWITGIICDHIANEYGREMYKKGFKEGQEAKVDDKL